MPDRQESSPVPQGEPEERVSFDPAGAIDGARLAVPLALGVFAYGLAFGVLARRAGLSVAESLLMSGLPSAGACQSLALGLWAAPLPVGSVVLATLFVTPRYQLMGAALAPALLRLRGRSLAYASVFFMADENWALAAGAGTGAAVGLRVLPWETPKSVGWRAVRRG